MVEIQDREKNEEYLDDKRWKLIQALVNKCMFGKANEVLCQLRKTYGLKTN